MVVVRWSPKWSETWCCQRVQTKGRHPAGGHRGQGRPRIIAILSYADSRILIIKRNEDSEPYSSNLQFPTNLQFWADPPTWAGLLIPKSAIHSERRKTQSSSLGGANLLDTPSRGVHRYKPPLGRVCPSQSARAMMALMASWRAGEAYRYSAVGGTGGGRVPLEILRMGRVWGHVKRTTEKKGTKKLQIQSGPRPGCHRLMSEALRNQEGIDKPGQSPVN